MDAHFYQSDDGGEIECVNGVITTSQGLESAVTLSLFGGNDDDDGTDRTEALQWWGNFIEEEQEARILRSRFQAMCITTPLNSATLQLFQEAVEADLAWMISSEVVDSITVTTSITAPKRLAVEIVLSVRTDTYQFRIETAIGTRDS